VNAAPVSVHTAKITYTSGTTGAPKGVRLGSAALATVAASLAAACGLKRDDRHCSLLPLATLLENVAVYANLQAGACVVLRPLQGTASASGALDGNALMQRLAADRPTTAVLIPEMLRAIVEAAENGIAPVDTLRLLAVGGAPVAKRLLERAARQRLPVYEGYGLSECGSVVALNTNKSNKPGTVGRPLEHVQIRFAEDGEILVRGALFDGYVGDSAPAPSWHATGDLGTLDGDGHLQITGRKKNIFITSHGRNVAPEWVESELTAQVPIAQAWVHGEARPWNIAVIVPAPGATAADVDAALNAANAGLPPYARVRRWLAADMPFSTANGQLTPNGRLRRDALARAYCAHFKRAYAENVDVIS
jgi:long-subunit acyl-CoA synthetase (AMP-forming)